MEEANLQKAEKEIKTTIEEKEPEKTKEETPKGYYFAEVPTGFAKVIAINGKAVDTENLILAMANCLKDNLGFKLE